MANVSSWPNNQDEYRGAEDVMKWLHGRTSGVFAADDNAAVTAVQNSMAVNVSDGLGWMANANKDGIVWWNETEKTSGSKLQLTIDAADGTLNRIDRVIVEWKTTDYADRPEIKVLKGTAASTAAAPALTNNSTVRQISLAQVSVTAGTTAITPTMITDERLNNSVCGLVTEFITADTSMINAQYLDAVEQLRSAINQAWEGELSDGVVTAAKLAALAVETAKIKDKAVTTAKLADHAVSVDYTTTLNTTWSGSAAPYTKEQTINGILATDKPLIDLVPSATFADATKQENAWALIYRAVTAANKITFYAKAKPTVSIPLQIRCVRK